MSRYVISLIEQAIWSLLNLGVNLTLVRLLAPVEYGSFVFWANCGYVLASMQNAVSVGHLFALPSGEAQSSHRRDVERIMHGVTGAWLLLVFVGCLVGALALRQAGNPLGRPEAAFYVTAFLLQQYVRSLAFSRGAVVTAAVQTSAVLLLGAAMIAAMFVLNRNGGGAIALTCLATAYGVVGVIGAWRAVARQMSGIRLQELMAYKSYLMQSGWIFLGVTTTELLARFYSFVVVGWFGAASLAELSTSQLLLRPIPLLATSWSMVARGDLVQKREAGDWKGIARQTRLVVAGGIVVSIVWTGLVFGYWARLDDIMFRGKYANIAWMVLLWGVASALSFGQVAVSAALQALKAFKQLAIANAAASAVAVVAILVLIRLQGQGGAIIGTAVGQALEAGVMAIMLFGMLRRGTVPVGRAPVEAAAPD